MARNVIKTLTDSKNTVVKLPSGGTPGTPQSLCVVNNSVVVLHNKNNENKVAVIRKYIKTGYILGSEKVNYTLGHCNGATYCSKDNKIYVAAYSTSKDSTKIVAINKNTFKFEFDFDLPVAISSVAYDSVSGKFYCGKGTKMYVFNYSSFKKGGDHSSKNFISFTRKAETGGQDVCCYDGMIYSIIKGPKNSYIDLYRKDKSKGYIYKGSIKIEGAMVESCDFTSNGNLVYVTSSPSRHLVFTNYSYGEVSSTVGGGGTKGGKKKVKANLAFVATAKKELKAGVHEVGSTNNVKYNTWYYGHEVQGPSGDDRYPWCAVFVAWCGYKTFGDNKVIPKAAGAHTLQDSLRKNGEGWVKHTGAYRTHVGIIAEVNNGTATTVEGNYGNKVGSRTISVPKNSQPGDIITFAGGSVASIRRPAWPEGEFEVDDDGTLVGADGEMMEDAGGTVADFNQTTSQLYSSANYSYVTQEDKGNKKLQEDQQRVKDFLQSIHTMSSPPQTVAIPDVNIGSVYDLKSDKKERTKVNGDISGSSLPSTISLVEAPYIRLTLGGVDIGTYKDGNYPNYLNSVTVKKTNGSLNEYSINLTHQIRPGDNPSYIDNLISKNSYEKIKITYGDANSGTEFTDVNPLLIGAKSNFDFLNNSINYTLSATSSSVMSVVHRRSYPAVTAKPSDIIRKMLFETKELLPYFPTMSNETFVNSKNLIPSNDKEITIDAVTNTIPLNYLNTLVGGMTKEGGDNDSIYYLSIVDDGDGSYFNIQEVDTRINKKMFPLIYEVDINYPNEDSLVFNFQVNTNYAWPLAYEYGGKYSNYNYDIDNNGNVNYERVKANLMSSTSSNTVSISDKNWWTNVTEFPINATLEVKGLTSHVLLLQYIKINAYYFGNKLNSSGVYIVTGQEDTLSGNGFRTKLDLLRVAGDGQYITTDGRVIT